MQCNCTVVQGMFCPRGSAQPRKCPALAACPAGAAAPGFNAGAFITIVLVVLVYLAVFLTARHCLRRRSARRKQQQASRNQVCCLKASKLMCDRLFHVIVVLLERASRAKKSGLSRWQTSESSED